MKSNCIEFKLKKIKYLCLFFLCVMVAGCGGQGRSVEGNTHAATGYAVTDDSGNILKFTQKPVRIYASTVSLEEILVDLVPPERIVAISEPALDKGNSLIPEKAARIAVHVPQRVSVEQLLKLKPDLVIAQDNNAQEYIQSLKDVGLKVFIVRVPVTADKVRERIGKMADAVGEKAAGDRMLAEFDAKLRRIKEVTDKIPEKKIIMAYSTLGVFGSSQGIFNAICINAGVINGAAKAGLNRGEHLSKEKIIAVDPDAFLFPSDKSITQGDMDGVIREVMEDPAFARLKAVRDKRYIYIKDRYRYAASQYFADAALLIARETYPEYFKKETNR